MAEQVSILAIPITAAVLLHATPSQMGTLVALELLPFAIFALPLGVWLDRNRKFPILLCSQIMAGCALVSIPIAALFNILVMPWLYTVAFVMGIANLVGGGSAQVFLTNIVSRDQLVDAHSKFAITDSGARLLGPGIAGLLIQWLTAPIALLFNGICFFFSVLSLSGIKVKETIPPPSKQNPWQEVIAGIRFVRTHPVLWPLAWGTAIWQIFFNGFFALQVLFATRELGMSAGLLGAAQMMGGIGVLVSSLMLKPLTKRIGTGGTILLGMSGTALGWFLLSNIPSNLFGSATYSAILYAIIIFIFDCSTMLYFMPYLALRVKVTPDEFLGRMISTIRFMTVAVAPLGAYSAGWLAEHFGLRIAITGIAFGAILLSLAMYFYSPLRTVRE